MWLIRLFPGNLFWFATLREAKQSPIDIDRGCTVAKPGVLRRTRQLARTRGLRSINPMSLEGTLNIDHGLSWYVFFEGTPSKWKPTETTMLGVPQKTLNCRLHATFSSCTGWGLGCVARCVLGDMDASPAAMNTRQVPLPLTL